MKKVVLLPLALFALTMSGCNSSPTKSGGKKSSSSGALISTSGVSSTTGGGSTSASVYIPTSTSSSGWVDPGINDPFSITNESGEASGFELSGSTYTINTA